MTLLPFFARFSLGFYVNTIMYLIVIIITVRILLSNRDPNWAVSMLLVLYFLPFIGIPVYLLNGVNWRKRKIVKHIPERIFKDNLSELIRRQRDFLKDVPSDYDNDAVKMVRMLLKSSGAILTMNNKLTFYDEGENLFRDIIQDIESAEKSIHMEYFLWRSDELGEKIKDALIKKVSEGVEVRILFDGVGCFRMMSRRYKKQLRKGGIQTRYFLNPLNPLSGWLLNYCNHRKVIVVDGEIGYTGGMNMGNEYIDGGRRFKTWRDTHIKLQGDTVNLLQAVFMADWENSGGTIDNEAAYLSQVEEIHGQVPMQIVTSGPDSDWHSLKELYFNMIANANEEILVASPYFVVDSAIEEALITAALAGVHVKIIMAGSPPDKWVPFWVAHTYYERLISAGVEFYHFKDGFFHSKYLVVDSRLATVGTCNMDIRSFQLHYEINTVIYDSFKAASLKELFEVDLSRSRKISLEECENLGFFRKLRNSIFRMFAPLL